MKKAPAKLIRSAAQMAGSDLPLPVLKVSSAQVSATDLSQYAGTLPYDAELFGVYHPLLNWYGYRNKNRVAMAQASAASSVIQKIAREFDPVSDRVRVGDASQVRLQLATMLQSHVGASIAAAASKIVARTGQPPTPSDWQKLLAAEALQKQVDSATASPSAATSVWPAISGLTSSTSSADDTRAIETATAEFFRWTAVHAPQVLNPLFLTQSPAWQTAITFVDPLASPSGNGSGRLPTGVLSPVGLINLYREYFYELNTFLGPPVGHMWVSPGGSLDVYESSTRKRTVEQTVEASTTVTAKSEDDNTQQDELSDAVKNNNKNDTKLGASVSGGGSVGVYHADAAAQFNTDSSRESSSETAHKHSRTQSSKLSKEITENYKTTFETVTETTDTTSRHYLLTNTNSTILNIELRRKLRLIGVQLRV